MYCITQYITDSLNLFLQSIFMTIPYIILTSFLARFGRILVNKCTDKETGLQRLFLEAIASAEMCANAPEFTLLFEYYGTAIYSIYLFVINIWYTWTWGPVSACPYYHLEEYIEEKCNILDVFLRSLVELIAGLIALRYVHFIWGLGFNEIRLIRIFNNTPCYTDLKVSVLFGAFVEGSLTCLFRLVSRILTDIHLANGIIYHSIFGTLLTLIALNYSGGYFNPVLATCLKFGCQGSSVVDHIFVYWFGAYAGSVASVYIYKSKFVQEKIEKYD